MKALLRILFVLLTLPAHAQEDDIPGTQDARVRDKIQAVRVAYITDQLQLTPAEAERFWPIYREFADKRRDLRRQLTETPPAPQQGKTSEQVEKEMVDRHFNVKQQELNLERDYSARLLNVISAQKLRTLPDAERRFRQMILEQIQRRQQQMDRQRDLQDQNQKRLQQRNN
jgi:hypothetical protein